MKWFGDSFPGAENAAPSMASSPHDGLSPARSAVSSADGERSTLASNLIHPLLRLGAGEVLLAGVHYAEFAAVRLLVASLG